METGFLNRVLDDEKYVIYVPATVTPPYPAILFLHGRGESGQDGWAQTDIGLGHAIRRNPDAWPFLVVLPQKPTGEIPWQDRADQVADILARTEEEFLIDPVKRYITGLSQGGHGTFSLATRVGWTFAAAVAICGRLSPEVDPLALAPIPFWIFQGADDTVTLPIRATEAAEVLKSAGGAVRLTIYPDVGHNSWDHAYADPDLPRWLLGHTTG